MSELETSIGRQVAFSVFLCAWIIALPGCESFPVPSAEQIATAPVATAPSDYQKQIKDTMDGILIDPTSPLWKFDAAPYKDYTNRTGVIRFGWRVEFRLNSKNRLGGYTGWSDYSAYFDGGKLDAIAEVNGDYRKYVYLRAPMASVQ